ncbi:MAG: PAS domain S-box protein, partial [Chloroflexi bacterium]|nr:PAS domain S-box protein [Chloroflexota bacterium]
MREGIASAVGIPAGRAWAMGAGQWRRWLGPYRPRFEDWRFWAVQGLVVLVAGIHTLAEALEVLGEGGGFQPLYFVPSALFFIPVVYAALNFGFAGAVATAVWCTVLTVPNWVLFHQGWDRVGCLFQVGAVDAIGVFVGQRVERERAARRHAEAAGMALRASESRYRGLFESSPGAVLVLDSGGVVLEANPAAGELFQREPGVLRGEQVAALVGEGCAREVLGVAGSPEGGTCCAVSRVKQPGGGEVYLEPTVTRISDGEGKSVVQVLLRDVTEER